jgi:AcrR family transcriptional regulator
MAPSRRPDAPKPPSTIRAAGVRKEKAAETEAMLKEAARRTFARQGYLNTKITDITAEAGRAAGSFYNHFASKEELLEALAADIFSQATERITQHGTDHDLSDPTQLREHVATTWYAFKTHVPELAALNEAALVDPNLARRVGEMRALRVAIMRDHLERLRREHWVLPGDTSIVASAMVSLLEQFCTVWLIRGGDPPGRQLSDDEAIDTLTAFILRGIIGTAS